MQNGIIKQIIQDIAFGDSASADAFGRARTSTPYTLWDSTLQYDDQAIFWHTDNRGISSHAYSPYESLVELRVGTNAGDRTVRQTKSYFPYQSGKSQLVIMSFVFGAAKAGVRRRVGYFDDYNGIYLEQTETDVALVLRSNTTGIVSERRIAQSTWDADTFDGEGTSAVTLDASKAQILLIDLEWLGVGRVRCGFVINGQVFYAHHFEWANTEDATAPYMATATLPIRYEIENTALTVSNSVLKQICCTVASEGGFEISRGRSHSVNNGITPISVSTRRPILSIRPKLTYDGKPNHVVVELEETQLHNQSQSLLYEIVYGGTLATPSWISVDSESAVEYDQTSTTISGGIVIASGYAVGAAGGAAASKTVADQQIRNQYPITISFNGSSSYPVSVVGTAFSSSANVNASLDWIEIA